MSSNRGKNLQLASSERGQVTSTGHSDQGKQQTTQSSKKERVKSMLQSNRGTDRLATSSNQGRRQSPTSSDHRRRQYPTSSNQGRRQSPTSSDQGRYQARPPLTQGNHQGSQSTSKRREKSLNFGKHQNLQFSNGWKQSSNRGGHSSRKGPPPLDRMYGYYRCKVCGSLWESSRVFCIEGTKKVYFKQDCKKCGAACNPYQVEPLICSHCQKEECICTEEDKEKRHIDKNKTHRADLCHKCRAGYPCQEQS